jgi:hypothetical protein
MEKKVEIRSDIAKNRLIIVLSGFITDGEAKVAADKAIAETAKLRSGFDVINDSSNFKPASANGAQEIFRAVNHMKQIGIGHAMRISGDAVITDSQLTRISKEAGFDQGLRQTAGSVAEAERILDGKA